MSNDQDEQQDDDAKSVTSEGWTGRERRRLGRVKFTNPHLIALLRGKPPTADATDAPNRAAERDDLGTAKGIMLAVAISATIWGAVVLTEIAHATPRYGISEMVKDGAQTPCRA